MYNILQLNDKDLSELQSIAKELGVKNAESLKKDDLVYSILDEQAIANASKKAEKDNETKEPRKRTRVSMKKEGDKVYTATKDKAQKLEAVTPEIQTKPLFNTEAVKAKEENADDNAPEMQKEQPEAEKPAPKKRGRKAKAKNPEENVQENAEDASVSVVGNEHESQEANLEDKAGQESELMAPMSQTDEFIPIEDLPSDNQELPRELIGKVQSTKGETTAQAAMPNNRFQQRNPKNNNPRNNKYNNQNAEGAEVPQQ
jgi:transcription termination factor Rho